MMKQAIESVVTKIKSSRLVHWLLLATVLLLLNVYLPFRLLRWTHASLYSYSSFDPPGNPCARLVLTIVLIMFVFVTELLIIKMRYRNRKPT